MTVDASSGGATAAGELAGGLAGGLSGEVVGEVDGDALDRALRRKWLDAVGLGSAFYVNFAITSVMVLLVAGAPHRAALAFGVVAVAASLIYRAAGLAFERWSPGPPSDRVILCVEAIPLVGWAVASGWAAQAAMPSLDVGPMPPGAPSRGLQPFSPGELAVLTANWGGAMIAAGMFAAARLSALLLARLLSLALFASFLWDQPIDAAFANLAAAMLLTGLAAGIGYLSHVRLVEETRLQLALAAARERAAAEYERRQTILRSIGHDLRQPLSALKMLLGPMRSRLGAEDPAYEAMAGGVRSAHELVDGIEQMAWLSDGRDRPRPTVVDVGALIHGLASEMSAPAQARGVRLRATPTSLRLRSDPVMLRRILRNLIDNAVKHGGAALGGVDHGAVGDGAVDHGADVGGARRVVVGVRRRRGPSGAPAAEIWVLDDGPGIGPSDHARLFDEFARADGASVEGLGVGLAVVKDLSRALGAEALVISTPGRGAAFGVRFEGEAVIGWDNGDGAAQSSSSTPFLRAQ
ncbi:MAG: HAMP domain-containing sensor histidine kinase [Pseudomonadota bacterium]